MCVSVSVRTSTSGIYKIQEYLSHISPIYYQAQCQLQQSKQSQTSGILFSYTPSKSHWDVFLSNTSLRLKTRSWLHFCNITIITATITTTNNNLIFQQRNVTTGMKFGIETELTKIRCGDKCSRYICSCNICPDDNCWIF